MQIGLANALFLLRRDRALDRHRFGAFDNGSDDRAADQIAAIKCFFATAAQRHFQEFVFFSLGKLPIDKALDQLFDRRANVIGLFRKRAVVGKIVGEINSIDVARALLIRAIDFYFPIDTPGTENCGVDQVGAIGSENNDDVVE